VIPHDGWGVVHARAEEATAGADASQVPVVAVTEETTLEACRRLAATAAPGSVLALNFASAKNRGGTVPDGPQPQEETLGRSSALSASLGAAGAHYEANRRWRDHYHADSAVYSPGVVVFRDDAGTLLDDPYEVAFVMCPAVNVAALRLGSKFDEEKVEETMRRRIGNVLALAASQGHRTPVLGAWGCGGFGNDPKLVARLFAEALAKPVGRCFDRVTFAIHDTGPDLAAVTAFMEQFKP
jgi:uncharacterized protein (TIGR02452 family)